MAELSLSDLPSRYPEHDVIIEFPDLNGISRSKLVSVDKLAEHESVSMQLSLLALSPNDTFATDAGYGTSVNFADGTLHPDLSTVTEVPWLEDTIRVIADFHYDGEPVPAYTRGVLQRVLDSLPDELSFGIGPELEFFLMDGETGNRSPLTTNRNECVTFATEPAITFYRRLKEWGREYGLDIDTIHKEEAPGQYEALFEYGGPVTAADAAFDFRRVVRRAADDVGLHGTFMPKPLSEEPGSGCHLHVSAKDDGSNAFVTDDSLSDMGRSFVAGVLEHADGLTALCNPTLNSFKRQRGGYFAATTASWGYDNRLTLLRVPPGEMSRIEVRLPSSDSNPYLAIAGVLAAGYDGIKRDLTPPDPIDGLPDDEATPSLPRSLEQALDALESDSVLKDTLGEDVIDVFCKVKRAELDQFYETTSEWERDEYLENL